MLSANAAQAHTVRRPQPSLLTQVPMRIVSAVVLAFICAGCGLPPPANTAAVTRSGVVCDSLIARLAAGDSSIRVQEAAPTALVLMPNNPPSELRGKALTFRFFVDPQGRSAVDPAALDAINSRDFRDAVRRRLEEFTFAPAVAEGCAVPDTTMIRITFP